MAEGVRKQSAASRMLVMTCCLARASFSNLEICEQTRR